MERGATRVGSVDAATGELGIAPIDIDLGGSLRFQRHYASGKTLTSELGKGWIHSLDWAASMAPLLYDTTAVTIDPPFGAPAVYALDSAGTWHKSPRDAGAVEIDGLGRVVYTAGDGVKRHPPSRP